MTKRKRPVSVAGVARREVRADQKAREAVKGGTGSVVLDTVAQSTMDSFVNYAQKMGVGADNALTSAGYGFNPITRQRNTLEWIHRGSWLGGVAVDLVADDMTRAGMDLQGDLEPEQMEQLEEASIALGIWNQINETIKWSRLYGGALAVMMVDGQDFKTPLRVETIGKGQFKGLMVLDRWMVDPSMNDLVTAPGPDLGLPKFYNIIADAPALPRLKIHHTRCVRLEGIRLPYWQRLQEQMWGISVIERLYDRMIAFDSATTGAAQLVYKAYIRTYKIKDLRQIVAMGGPALNGLVAYTEFMRRMQGIEGITLLDMEDDFAVREHGSFAGLSDALVQFGQQLSGALQIPLVRLFGQSPSGLNSTGESDLRMYYDNIKQQQEKTLRVPVTTIYRALAQSEGIKLPDGFRVDFRSLWQLADKEKAEIAETTTRAVTQAQEAGLITDKVAGEELRQSARVTGIFSNISDEDIDAANDELPPSGEEAMRLQAELMGGAGGTPKPGSEDDPDGRGDRPDGVTRTPGENARAARDSAIEAVTGMKRAHDLDVVIETAKGTIRRGGSGAGAWEVTMPADYGYVRKTIGDDGEQVDCYVGPHHDSLDVWVIKQIHADTQAPDEDKVMLGYRGMNAALFDYLKAHDDGRGWDRIGAIEHMPMARFKTWLTSVGGVPA